MTLVRRASVLLLAFGALVAVTAGAPPPRRATRVLVKKRERRMQVFAGEDVLAVYRVSLGPGGAGPKRMEGDRITPVGRYHVTMHQPSTFKIFLRLDYPNAEDRARFERAKKNGELRRGATIGGDIGIHGGTTPRLKDHDWTLGCVAVEDDEIVEIARAVPDGTVVDIED